MQHHAFADIEADVDAPLFPLHMVAAGDREARAFRLGDADGFLGGAQRAGEFGIGVVSVLLGDRDGPQVQHLGHFLADHVNVGNETVNWVRPGAVLRKILDERQAAQDPASLFLGVFKDTGGQWRHPDLTDLQVPCLQGGQPAFVSSQKRFNQFELLFQDGKFAGHGGVQFDGRNHLAPVNGDHHVHRHATGNVVDEDPEAAVHAHRPLCKRCFGGPGAGRVNLA